MEITAQISALQEEINVLKGQIKSILEEIRTTLLDRDNPLAAEDSLPVFQPVARSEPAGGPASEPEEASPGPTTAPATASGAEDSLPSVLQVEPAAGPPGPGDGPQAAPMPPMPGGGGPQAAPTPPMPGDDRQPAAPSPIAEAAAAEPWSVSAIASLIAWVDETTSRLDATHLHMILDLARFAGLLPADAEEALSKVIKLARSRKDGDTASVNDILLALRQLEAIFQEADGDELSLSRRRRSAGAGR